MPGKRSLKRLCGCLLAAALLALSIPAAGAADAPRETIRVAYPT